MRFVFARIAIVSLMAFVAGCAKSAPPAGRWEGLYEAGDAIIVARLEIAPNGAIRVSAPDAFMDFADMSEDDRQAMRTRLQAELARAWPAVAPIVLDFDGKIFRKPGGVAPQLEWDEAAKQMAIIVYPGIHPEIRVPLTAVKDFGDGG